MAERSSERGSPAPLPKIDSSLSEAAETVKTLDDEASPTSPDSPECPVCLQSCVHPARLPCGHVFCFLCIKGAAAAQHSRRCALCRGAIPAEFFSNPALLERGSPTPKEASGVGGTSEEESAREDSYAWFYEGRNGWWQYDRRTGAELEAGYQAERPSLELLIAGHVYVVDLEGMVQVRRNDPSRRRRVKRDLLSAPKKGIAGLKIAVKPEEPTTTAPTESASQAEPRPGTKESAPSRDSSHDRDEAVGETPLSTPLPAPPLRQSGLAQGTALPGGGLGRTKSRTAGVGRDRAAPQEAAPSSHRSRRDNDSDESDENIDDDIEDGDSDDREWRALALHGQLPIAQRQSQKPTAPATLATASIGNSSSSREGLYEPMAPAITTRQRNVPIPAPRQRNRKKLLETSSDVRQPRPRSAPNSGRSLLPSTATQLPRAVTDQSQESLDRGLQALQLSPTEESSPFVPMSSGNDQPQGLPQQSCRHRRSKGPRPNPDCQS